MGNVAEKQAKKTIKKGKSPMWANFNCETFWYDGGDCDELNENAVNVQMVAKTLTSAPALAVGALLALRSSPLRRGAASTPSCKHGMVNEYGGGGMGGK